MSYYYLRRTVSVEPLWDFRPPGAGLSLAGSVDLVWCDRWELVWWWRAGSRENWLPDRPVQDFQMWIWIPGYSILKENITTGTENKCTITSIPRSSRDYVHIIFTESFRWFATVSYEWDTKSWVSNILRRQQIKHCKTKSYASNRSNIVKQNPTPATNKTL
jgi:hypothetical protein